MRLCSRKTKQQRDLNNVSQLARSARKTGKICAALQRVEGGRVRLTRRILGLRTI